MTDLNVTDAGPRFEAHEGDQLVGWVEFERTGDLVVITHTEVPVEHEGKGVGSALARGILDDTRERGLRALITCPFVLSWIGRHPEYADLQFNAPRRG